MSKFIPLTQGQFAIVDDADFDWISQWKWQVSTKGYAFRISHRSPVYMHRIILGAQSGQEVDHCNRNRLDNQRHNLRLCTSAESSQNRSKVQRTKLLRTPTSQYKGVHWRAARNRWEVLIQVNGKQIYIGRFKREQETDAALAYDHAARHYHGEFAVTNF